MRFTALATAAALFGTVGSAAAQGYGPPITLAQARRVAAAAEAEAVRGRDRMVIAVVDPSGAMVLLQRMDGAIHAADVLAPAKARSAAAFRQPTANFQQEASQPGGAFIIGVAGAERRPTTAGSHARAPRR